MPIKFSCPHCQRGLSVKDHLAGKRAACPACKKVLTIPVPATAPVAEDLDALAAAALADPKEEVAAPQTIDFPCPSCDEPIQMALELAGKRAQCPQCRNIIKVPVPEKKDPTNWRAKDNLPSGARRDTEPPPEGAWAPAHAKLVGREALEQAGVIGPDPRKALTRRQKITRAAVAASVVLALGLGGLAAYGSWSRNKQDALVTQAVSRAEEIKSREAAAVLHRAAGEYWLRAQQRTSAEKAQLHFDKARSFLFAAPPGAARDLLLTDLTLSELDLVGNAGDVDGGRRLKWDAVQKQISHTLNPRHLGSSSWAKFQAMRLISRKLVAVGQGSTATGLAAQLGAIGASSEGETLAYEGLELMGIVGLELLKNGDKNAAMSLFGQAMARYPEGAGAAQRPPLAPSVVALAMGLGQPEPRPGQHPEDPELAALGRVEGLARKGEWAPARAAIPPTSTLDLRVRAFTAIALANLDSGNPDSALLEEVNRIATEGAQARNLSPWALYRVSLALANGGRADDASRLADTILDPGLRGRAQVDILRTKLAAKREKAEEALLDSVDKSQPSAVALAREILARHNAKLDASSARTPETWDEAHRPFGQLGAALGLQDAR